ncbi:hypothetical protein [Pseudomonas phage vB_Pae_TUMS_P11]|nr:hypothetical protein [Pseudomonas phage vB_Pae_TUMS_P11]
MRINIHNKDAYTTVNMQEMEQSMARKFTTMLISDSLRKGESCLYIFDGLTEEIFRKDLSNVASGLMMSRLKSYTDPFKQLYTKHNGRWFVFSSDFNPVAEKLVPPEIRAQSLLFD